MKRRIIVVERPIETTVEIDGKTIEPGQPLVVEGQAGTFIFRYLWKPDGSLACWGGEGGYAEMRNFRPERCHLPKEKRKRRQMTEAQREANALLLAKMRERKREKKVTV